MADPRVVTKLEKKVLFLFVLNSVSEHDLKQHSTRSVGTVQTTLAGCGVAWKELRLQPRPASMI